MEMIDCDSACDWVWVARRPLIIRGRYQMILPICCMSSWITSVYALNRFRFCYLKYLDGSLSAIGPSFIILNGTDSSHQIDVWGRSYSPIKKDFRLKIQKYFFPTTRGQVTIFFHPDTLNWFWFREKKLSAKFFNIGIRKSAHRWIQQNYDRYLYLELMSHPFCICSTLLEWGLPQLTDRFQ